MKDHFVLSNMSTNEEIALVGDLVTLGRKDDCEIVVDSNEASRYHARITLAEGRATLEDLGSTNGTILNGRRLRQPEMLSGGDIFVIGQVHYLVVAPGNTANMTILGGRLGQVDDNYVVDQADPNMTGMRLPFPKPPGWSDKDDFADSKASVREPLRVLGDAMKRQPERVEGAAAVLMILSKKNRNTLLPLPAGKVAWTLGRTANNDVEISDITVSSQHAIVTRKPDGWHVEDRGSTNGTQLNGKSIESATLVDGDVLQLGKVDLLFKSL